MQRPSLVNRVTGSGQTALHLAAKTGRGQNVARLLAWRCKVQGRGVGLHWILQSAKDTTKLQSKCSTITPSYIVSFDGKTGLYNAACEVVAEILGEAKMNAVALPPFLWRTRDITARMQFRDRWVARANGETALLLAVLRGQDRAVEALLAHDPNLIDADG